MAENIYVDQKLENPSIRTLLEKRKSVDLNNKEETTSIMNELISEIVFNSKFLSPVNISKPPVYDAEGKLMLTPDTSITFVLLDNGKGERFFPIFTETAELEKWENLQTPTTVQLEFDRYAAMLDRNDNCEGIVINPFSDNLLVNKQIVTRWFEKKQIMQNGHAQHVITPDSDYEFLTLSPYPMQLSNKLCETAKTVAGINRMWLRGIRLNGEEGFLLVVDFTGDRLAVFSELGNAAKPYLEAKSIHVVSVEDNFGKLAVDKVLPIYSRD